MLHRPLALLVVLAALGLVPSAFAVGVPPSAAQGMPGVVSLDGTTRYVALAAGADSTTVEARSVATGQVLRSQVVPGVVGIPVAAGTTGTGLSADGSTLMLATIHPQDPGITATQTTMIAVSTMLVGQPMTFNLSGEFAVDAISPDAHWVYLIQRRHSSNPAAFLDYAVRAFDLPAGHLSGGAIVDRREPNEKMTGYPIARAMAGGGRYAFTLYDGLGKPPFVHALDTVGRSARCLDLPRSIKNLWSLKFRMASGGQRLLLAAGKHAPVAWIDTHTLRLHMLVARG
jgi:hypothetical protein